MQLLLGLFRVQFRPGPLHLLFDGFSDERGVSELPHGTAGASPGAPQDGRLLCGGPQRKPHHAQAQQAGAGPAPAHHALLLRSGRLASRWCFVEWDQGGHVVEMKITRTLKEATALYEREPGTVTLLDVP